MKVWILPGWQQSHGKDVLQSYAVPPETVLVRAAAQIRQTFVANKKSEKLTGDRGLVSFSLLLRQKARYLDCNIEWTGWVSCATHRQNGVNF